MDWNLISSFLGALAGGLVYHFRADIARAWRAVRYYPRRLRYRFFPRHSIKRVDLGTHVRTTIPLARGSVPRARLYTVEDAPVRTPGTNQEFGVVVPAPQVTLARVESEVPSPREEHQCTGARKHSLMTLLDVDGWRPLVFVESVSGILEEDHGVDLEDARALRCEFWFISGDQYVYFERDPASTTWGDARLGNTGDADFRARIREMNHSLRTLLAREDVGPVLLQASRQKLLAMAPPGPVGERMTPHPEDD